MSKELQQLQQQIIQLKIQNEQLSNENESLKKAQEEFQEALIAKVEEIEKTPKAWRWLKYGRLLWDLIETIKKTIDKVRNR